MVSEKDPKSKNTFIVDKDQPMDLSRLIFIGPETNNIDSVAVSWNTATYERHIDSFQSSVWILQVE